MNESYLLCRVPAEFDDHRLVGVNIHDVKGRFAGQVEPVGPVNIVPSEKLDRALACLKGDAGHCVAFRYLVGGLWRIGSEFIKLGELARQQEYQLSQMQQRVEFLIKKWETELSAKIKTAVTILKIADNKIGTEAKTYIENNHFLIDESLNLIELHVTDLINCLPSYAHNRVAAMRQLALIAQLRAKLYLLLGIPQESAEILDAFRSKVEDEATPLLGEWINGVDLRDIAPEGPDDLDSLLLAMEQIDGVGRYERLCNALYKLPRLPEKANLASLSIRKNTHDQSANHFRDRNLTPLESMKLVREGDNISWNNEEYVHIINDGYILIDNRDPHIIRPEECYILEIPASKRAAKEIGEHIRALADLVVEVRRMCAEGICAAACPDIAKALIPSHSLNNNGSNYYFFMLENKTDTLG